MAAFRSLSSTTYASRTNTTVTAPPGIQNGDMLILFFIIAGSGTPPTPTPPGGWTLLVGPSTSGRDGFNVVTRVYWRVASGESGNYTVTHTSASSQGLIYCASSAAAGAPAATNNQSNGNNGTTSTATGLTTSGNNALVLFWDHNWQLYGSASPPTGSTPTFTERLDASTSLMYLADGVLATAGATGNKSHSNLNTNVPDPWRAILLAIEDGGAAPSTIVRQMLMHGLYAGGGGRLG